MLLVSFVGMPLTLNSYDPLTTKGESDGDVALPNPAKPLLYVMGAFGLLQGFVGVPVGLFVGPHILCAAIGMLVFGSMAAWLGHRQYDRVGRYGTITWGGLAICSILVGTGLQPPSIQDVVGIAFIALLLLMVGTILIVAVWKRSGEFGS